MPSLLLQILIKLATLFLFWVCTKLKVDANPANLVESATWLVSAALAVAGFAWSTWRHKQALDENLEHRLRMIEDAFASHNAAATVPPTPQPTDKPKP